MPGFLTERMRVVAAGHCSCRGEGHGSAIWIVEIGIVRHSVFWLGVRKE